MDTLTRTTDSAKTSALDAPTVTTCMGCGTTLTPHGRCFNMGTCEVADVQASRLSRGETLKSRLAPLAVTLGGRVD